MTPSDAFGLACGPKGCRATCCKNGPPIVLNPYEISLICCEAGLSYEDLLDILETGRSNGFPLVMLPRNPACPFWTEKGCRVYRARPLACRLFPLGRVYHDGRSHLVLPERNLCTGLAHVATRTIEDYLRDQDTGTFLAMADHWIEFVNEMEGPGLPDRPVTSVVFHMLVYSPDTPPAIGDFHAKASPEERFQIRLGTARKNLSRFLGRA